MEYSKYRRHPRVLELMFTTLHTRFVLEYGIERTAILFQNFCEQGRINWSMISATIGRKDVITNMNISDRLRYRQEVVFTGVAFGESYSVIAKKYLMTSRSIFYEYGEGMLVPDNFLNKEWLEKLDYSVVLAGTKAYALEMERFINFVNVLGGVITSVPVAKV